MDILTDYEKELERGLRRLPRAERKAVVEEVRAHLMEAAARIAADDPVTTMEDAKREAVRRFGTAKEVADGYHPGSGQIRAGGIALQAARATGQDMARFTKWTMIAGFVLGGLILAGLASDLLPEIDGPDVPREVRTEQMAQAYRACDVASVCTGPSHLATFDLGPPTTKVEIVADGSCSGGRARIQAVDPSGDTVVVAEDICQGAASATFTEPGRWRIEVVYTGFQGSLHVSAWGYELR